MLLGYSVLYGIIYNINLIPFVIIYFKSYCLSGALQDFDKVSITNVEKNDTVTVDLQKQDKPEMSEDKWTEDFLKQTADQFEKNLQNLLQNGKLLKDV